MPERKSTAIEYAFEGNTLDLQEAIKQVNKLLTASVKQLKLYQNGVLTAEQNAQVKATRKLLKQMRAAHKQESTLDEKQKKETLTAGRHALKEASKLRKQAYSAEERMRKQAEAQEAKDAEKQAKRLQSIKEATSPAGLEQATQRASYLAGAAERLKGHISPEAYDEIMNAVRDYTDASKDASIGQEDLAGSVEHLNDVYDAYAGTLRVAQHAQREHDRSIVSAQKLFKQYRKYLEETTRSLTFYLQLLRKLVQLTKEGIQASADYTESMNFLSATVGDANTKFKEFVDLQQQSFGLDPTQVNTTAAMFYAFGDSLGFANKEAELIAANMTKLAADLASLQNTDLETMTAKLRSALAGNARAIASLGVSVHDATIEEWLMTKGVNASMEQLNEASQAAARYAYILEATTSAQGDLARTLRSPANQFRILNTQTELLVQNLGTLLMPLLVPLVDIVNGLLQPLNAFMLGLTSISSKNLSSSIGEGSEALEDFSEASEKASAGLTGLDEINQADAGQDTFAGITAEIQALLTGYDNLATGGSLLTESMSLLGESLAPILGMLASNPMALSLVFEALALVLWPVANLLSWISGIFQIMPEWLQKTIGGVAELAIVLTTVVALITLLKTLMSTKIWTNFVTVIGGMAKAFKATAIAVGKALVNLVAWIAKQTIATAQAIKQQIVNWALAGSYWKIAVAAIAAAGVAAAGVAAIALVASASANSQAQRSMNYSYSAPAMASGGVVKAPTLALVGEGRYNEAVIPLGNSPQFESMQQHIADTVVHRLSGGAGGSRGNTPVILQVNGRELARTILPDISAGVAQTGVKLKR